MSGEDREAGSGEPTSPHLSARAVPAQVVEVVVGLRRHGHAAFITGGAVRDMVIGGRVPEDWDVATSALPDAVQAIFDHTVPTGLLHGTLTVVHDGMCIEVTTYRADGPYLDGRHPEYVEFLGDIEGDLARRDFTVNAMAFDPITEGLIDPFGGQSDIQARVIRTVGPPEDRFREDRLRVMRAVRFAAGLGFDVEAATLESVAAFAPRITEVSVERITDEILKMLRGPAPARGFRLMKQTGLLHYIIPELDLAPADDLEMAICTCQLAPADVEIRLAALLRAAIPRQSAALARLRLPNATVRRVEKLVQYDGRLETCEFARSAPGLRRLAAQAGRGFLVDLAWLAEARLSAASQVVPVQDGKGFPGTLRPPVAQGLVAAARQAISSGAPMGVEDLAVTGGDVMRTLGIKPGPEVRRVLLSLLDAALDDPSVNNRDALLAMMPAAAARVRDS
ncbi:MAG: [cytidine(C)-cytidine(C)-adenosine (A)]-adding enzyme [Clostridia bacterium]|nr:[cytidine(C)-cytidine(C)-adenosine (A)]-adding enzyme [Clostridia bacterium]